MPATSSTTLIQNAEVIVTMDATRRELAGASILVEDGAITAVGSDLRFHATRGAMLHTHLAENDEDIAYSLEKFGCRPGQYAEDLGWTRRGRLARSLHETGRKRDRPVRPQLDGRGALPLLELSPWIGHRACAVDA